MQRIEINIHEKLCVKLVIYKDHRVSGFPGQIRTEYVHNTSAYRCCNVAVTVVCSIGRNWQRVLALLWRHGFTNCYPSELDGRHHSASLPAHLTFVSEDQGRCEHNTHGSPITDLDRP